MPVVIYGIDDGNNKIETMTKEQILDAIAQAQEGHSVFDYDDAFISKIKEINHGNQLRFWIGTQAEYNEIDPKENNVLYIISDDNTKEEILEAIENLAESISGVDAALANKQDVLTFDTAPTQNSTNPVTSGGIYTAFKNAIKRTVLWKRPSMSNTALMNPNDSVTLSDSIANYDFIEIQRKMFKSEWIDVGIMTYDANNGGYIRVCFSELQVYGQTTARLVNSEADIFLNNNTATIDTAETLFVDYENNTVTRADTHAGIDNSIYAIIGVKLP